MTDELQQGLWQALDLPYGKARSRALEAVAQRADGVDLDLAFAARVNLAHAYTMGGERRRMPVPFAWCLAEWDKDPARFAHHEHSLFWAFKFVPTTLVRFPEPSLDMTRATLDDMERRYRIGGHSMHAVHMSRFLVARHVGDADTEEHLRLWLAAPRDDLSDCLGCCPSHQVDHLNQQRRHDEAVALARPVLAGAVTCSEQPQEMQALALEPFVAEGMHHEAAVAHRASYRRYRGRARDLGMIAYHVRFCALTGNEGRALEIVDTHLPLLDDADSTLARMEFAAAASRALAVIAAHDPDLTVRTRDGRVPVADAAADLAALALDLGARFDERNGTGHQGDLVRATLAEEPWAEFLPLSPAAERAHLARQRAEARRDATPAEPAVRPDPPDVTGLVDAELLDVAEQAWWDRSTEGAGIAWDAYDAAVPAERRTVLDAARLAEGRALQAWVAGDLDAALDGLRTALVGFDEAGVAERGTRARARLSGLLLDRGEVEEAVVTGEQPLRDLASGEDARPTWAMRLGRLLLAAGRAEEAGAVLDDVDPAAVEADDRAAWAFLAGEVALELDRHEAAVERFTEVTDLVDDGPAMIMPLWRRGRAHLALGAASAAVDDLVEAVAQLSVVDEVNPSLHGDLAEAYLRADDAETAAQTVEEVLALLDDHEMDPLIARLVDLLARASEALGDLETARDRLARLLAFADEHGEPGWRLHLIEWDASLHERLDDADGATERWLRGARLADEAEWLLDAARLRRCAAGTALWAGDREQASALLDEAAVQLAGLDPAEPAVRFHEAGIAVQRGELALAAGRDDDAVRLAREAEIGFAAVGEPGAAAGALLLRLDAGEDVPVADLRGRWDELSPGSDRWYHLGYRLADRLRDTGAAADADALEARLQES